MILGYLLCGTGFLFGAIWTHRIWIKKSSEPFETRMSKALLPILGITLAALFSVKVYDVVFDIHNWIRLEKTFAIALGFPLYTPPLSGPAMANIYGPVSVLMYLPSTLSRHPMVALRIAEGLAILFFFGPPLWIHWRASSREHKIHAGTLCFFLFGLAAILLTSLRNAAFTVHADAPTLGLAALACACLYHTEDRISVTSMILSAFFAALAIWSKQVAVPVLPALLLFLWLRNGPKTAARYLLIFTWVGIAVSVIFFLFFDVRNMIFNMFIVPSQHPMKTGGLAILIKGLSKLAREWPVILLWGIFSMGLPLKTIRGTKAFSQWIRNNPWVLPVFVGIWMIPVSLLSFAKVGGSNNTLCYPNYFILLGSTLAFLSGETGSLKAASRALLTACTVLLCVHIPGTLMRISKISGQVNFGLIAYDYAKAHPGKTYFARTPLIHLLAEGKLYHTIDGLMDRHWAGFPINGKRLRDHIPEDAELLALDPENDKWLLPLEEFPVGYTDWKDLPGFVVYPRRRI